MFDLNLKTNHDESDEAASSLSLRFLDTENCDDDQNQPKEATTSESSKD